MAITGIACRFPGAPDLAAFWANLRAGRDTISRFRADELVAAGVDPALVRDPRYVPARGVIDGAECFDRAFFGYSPADAAAIDPQQRVFLEAASACLDDAGVDPVRFPGWIGVFAGADVAGGGRAFQRDGADAPAAGSGVDAALMFGHEKDFLATRVAYKLGLRGPALSVQTACSTSLVAVHLACQSLLGHECDAALAGGVALAVPQVGGYLHRDGHIGSVDGRCRPFDADASGSVASSGVGVVLLRRLADALADGDRVVAVIRGSAINNDGGEKVGFTAPSVAGQRDVISLALAQADVSADAIGYVEAHGTGTILGDPVEVAALSAAFRESTDRTGYCWLGAVKSNIGHTGAAAGIAGLIKAALVVEHRELVPTAHFRRPNPGLRLETTPFRISDGHRPWTGTAEALAGVSSFGMGGTNAHAVLGPAPDRQRVTRPARPRLFGVSAASAPALDRLAANLADRMGEPAAPPAAEITATLAARRVFPHRLAVVADDPASAATRLRAEAGRAVVATDAPAVAFVLPGQGTLGAGAAAAAHAALPGFRSAFEDLRAEVGDRFAVDLRPLLEPDADANWFRDTQHQQLGLVAVGLALADALAGLGVRPAALLGHSVGEYAAAALAGVWSRSDVLGLVSARARAMRAAAPGRMLAVAAPAGGEAAGLAAHVLGRHPAVALAVDAPDQLVFAGDPAAITALAAELTDRQRPARLLDTERAFHSPLIRSAAEPLRDAVKAVAASPPSVPVASNLTGRWLTAEQAADPEYWVDHLCATVRLTGGLGTLLDTGVGVLVELGPGTGVGRSARRHARWPATGLALPTLGAPNAGPERVLSTLARLWERGVPVDLSALADDIDGTSGRVRCALPPHPFAPTVCTPLTPRQPSPVDAAGSPTRVSTRPAGPVAVLGGSADDAALLAESGVLVAASVPARATGHPVDPAALLAGLPRRAPDRASRARRDALAADVDQYCAGLIGRFILDWTGLRPGERFRRADARELLDPHQRLPRLADALVAAMTERGWLVSDGPDLVLAADLSERIAAALSRRDALADRAGLCELVDHCVAGFPAVLAGETEAVAVLFPDGDDTLLRDLLGRDRLPVSDAEPCLSAVAELVVALRRARGGGPLRVLEVGAGSGELTRRLVAAGAGLIGSEPGDLYHVTDLSPLRVRQARRLADPAGGARLRFSVFDITRDPTAQGLAPGCYDLVLAYNVMHLAPDVAEGVAGISRLLAPNGTFAMVELAQVRTWMNLVWGLAPGWWDHDDAWRHGSTHLSPAAWRQVLAGNGFGRLGAYHPAAADADDEDAGDHVVIAASVRGGPDDRAELAADPIERIAAEIRRQRGDRPLAGLLRLPGPADGDRAPDLPALWDRLRPPGEPGTVPEVLCELAPTDTSAPTDPRVRRLVIGELDPERARALPQLLADPAAGHQADPAGLDAATPQSDGISAAGSAPPRGRVNPARDTLAGLWCDALGVASVEPDDDFFALGGESLLAISLLTRIQQTLGRSVPLTAFVDRATFGALLDLAGVPAADRADEPPPNPSAAASATAVLRHPNLLTLRAAGTLPPLFLAAPGSGSSVCYRAFADRLGPDQPVYGLESRGLHDGLPPARRVVEIAAGHVDRLRQVRPTGPYALGGWSVGALVAHEMARQLVALGEQVTLVLCLDACVVDTHGLPLATVPTVLRRAVRYGTRMRRAASRRPAVTTTRPGRDLPRGIDELARQFAGDARFVRVFTANLSAMTWYRPRPVAAAAAVFSTRTASRELARLRRRAAPMYGGPVEVTGAGGDHWTMLAAPHVASLAEAARQALELAAGRAAADTEPPPTQLTPPGPLARNEGAGA